MSCDSTIPSQLAPIDTMPTSLGAPASYARPRRAQPSGPWAGIVLAAAIGMVIVCLVYVATGA
jgi:hypothetical protein